MYWITVLLIVAVLCIITMTLFNALEYGVKWVFLGITCGLVTLLFCVGVPLSIVKQNIHDKYDWYIETRLKYAEAEGIEKMYLEMNDVMTYNLWYERNKEDLENPWNFKSSTRLKFDYIKVGD